jgi:hypothetical protein
VNNEEQISTVFAKLVFILIEMGYVDLDFIAVDGTKIKAYAGAKFTGKKENFEKRRKTLQKKIRKLIQEKTSQPEEKERNDRKLNQFKKDKDKIDNFLKDLSEKEEKNKSKISNITDTDSRSMKVDGSFKMGYNCQAGVDKKNGVIVGVAVNNKSTDFQQLQPMVEKIE